MWFADAERYYLQVSPSKKLLVLLHMHRSVSITKEKAAFLRKWDGPRCNKLTTVISRLAIADRVR